MAMLIRFFILSLVAFWAVRIIKSLFPPLKSSSPSKSKQPNPYEILGINSNASAAEIKAAYKEALAKYHPDKVDHLGEDLKRLAREKTYLITQAYEQIRPQ